MNFITLTLAAGLVVACGVARADLQRRGLSPSKVLRSGLLPTLDVVCPALAMGTATVLVLTAARNNSLALRSPLTWGILACVALTLFIWREGRRQIQFQRPQGIVFGESLILAGAYGILQTAIFSNFPGVPRGSVFAMLGVTAVVAGAAMIGVIVPRFKKTLERHRILKQLSKQEECVQREYVQATPECPHPERWQMMDSQTCELEVLEFLKSVVTTVKPQLIVETGTFIGHSAIKMAEGLKANGFGRIITIEYDPAVFAKAKECIDASGLGEWIECRNESSLESKIEGTIDLFFSDSYLPAREKELRHFLPQIDPRGLILVHDASSHFQAVRESMLRLEQEGLISTVLLSTPRGIAVAQKREGRK